MSSNRIRSDNGTNRGIRALTQRPEVTNDQNSIIVSGTVPQSIHDDNTRSLTSQLLLELQSAIEKSKSGGHDGGAEVKAVLRGLPAQYTADGELAVPITRTDIERLERQQDSANGSRDIRNISLASEQINQNARTSHQDLRKAKAEFKVCEDPVDAIPGTNSTTSAANTPDYQSEPIQSNGTSITSLPDLSPSTPPSPPSPRLRPADDVCYAIESYAFPIRIYECQKKPQVVARDLHYWEQRHHIAALLSSQDDEHGVSIPDDAIYLIVLQHITWDPMGSVLFFASPKQSPALSPACRDPESGIIVPPHALDLDLKVGYYYDYKDSLLPWIDTIISPNTPFPLVEAHSMLRPGTSLYAYREFYNRCRDVINREYHARTARPSLRWASYGVEWSTTRRKEHTDSRIIRKALRVQRACFDDPDEVSIEKGMFS